MKFSDGSSSSVLSSSPVHDVDVPLEVCLGSPHQHLRAREKELGIGRGRRIGRSKGRRRGRGIVRSTGRGRAGE